MLPAPRHFPMNKRAVNKVARTNRLTRNFFSKFPVLSPAPGINFYFVEVGSSTRNRNRVNRLKERLAQIKNRNANARYVHNAFALATRNNAFTRLVNAMYNATVSNRMRPGTPPRSPKRRRLVNNRG